MKKILITMVMCVLLIVSFTFIVVYAKNYSTQSSGQVAYTAKFSDISADAWYFQATEYCVRNGLMNGTSDQLFSPEMKMTRAMLVTVLYRLIGEPAVSGEIYFDDVETNQWYTDAIIWAYKSGIAYGVADMKFAPDQDITREQVVTILYRYWLLDKAAIGGFRKFDDDFLDADQISSFAYASFGWAIENDIVNGTASGYLNPKENATRAELAAMLMRFCKYGLYVS